MLYSNPLNGKIKRFESLLVCKPRGPVILVGHMHLPSILLRELSDRFFHTKNKSLKNHCFFHTENITVLK